MNTSTSDCFSPLWNVLPHLCVKYFHVHFMFTQCAMKMCVKNWKQKGMLYLLFCYISTCGYPDLRTLWSPPVSLNQERHTQRRKAVNFIISVWHNYGFVGLAYQRKDIIVFRFILEYGSLRDFGPPKVIIGLFFIWRFMKHDLWDCV